MNETKIFYLKGQIKAIELKIDKEYRIIESYQNKIRKLIKKHNALKAKIVKGGGEIEKEVMFCDPEGRTIAMRRL